MNFAEPTLAIMVVQAGHVLIGRAQGGDDGTIYLYDARTIRRWGTTAGLGQLYSGPTTETVIDAKVPLILLPVPQVIYALPVQENPAWGI
jgi:hypothetical protein